MLLAWPPRPPDATPCDFFPASIPELKVRIRTAIETITTAMLQLGKNSIIVFKFVESQRVNI